jgi:hypothetical protein
MKTTLLGLFAIACTTDPGLTDHDPTTPPTTPPDLCEDGLPVATFDAEGPYGFRRGDLAEDVTLQTTDGEFVLSEQFGCTSFGFLPETDQSTDPSWPTLWERDLEDLLDGSPDSVQWLFFTDGDDPRGSRDALQAELDTILADFTNAKAAKWEGRLHVLSQTPDRWNSWPEEKWNTTGYGFVVGRDQRIRDVGSLADGTRYDQAVGWFESNIKHAANEIVAVDFAYGRQQELDADGRRVMSLLDQTVTGAAEVLLDEDFTTVTGLDVDLSLGCPGDLEFGNCPAWDYLIYLHECGREIPDPAAATEPCQPYVPAGTATPEIPADTRACSCSEPDDSAGEHLRTCLADGTGYGACPCACEELARWVTPYHRGGRWVHDISPLATFLADPGPDRLVFSTSQTYEVDLSFRLEETATAGPPDQLTYLFSGGTFLEDYNLGRETLLVDIPASATKVELVAVISGHGFGADSENCAEFCNHTHHFFVNGVEHVKDHPEANTDEGCVEQVAEGTTPNQFGTWFFGRGGWCPGLEIAPWVVDVTADVTPGTTAAIDYEGLLDGEPYEPNLTGGTFYPRIDMVSWLAVTE